MVVTHPITARYLLTGQLSYLRECGFEVCLLSAPGRDLEHVAAREGVVCEPIPLRREMRPFSDFLGLVALVRALKRIDPDIVCAGTPKAGLLGMVAAALTGCPHRVYLVRGLRLETSRGLKRVLLRFAEKIAAARAHRVVFVSHSLRRVYLEMGLTTSDKAVVLADGSSNGVDTERFQPPAITGRVRDAHDAPTIGFIGRLVHDKGIEDLARAFEHVVLPRFPTARLLVLGDFESGDPVPQPVRDLLEHHSQVDLRGWVTDSATWYSTMDVVAFPSYREGFPNVPLQAAACAVPVVGYRATGTIDAVVDGGTGRLVPRGDWRSLGDELCVYLGDAETRNQHGEAARRRVEMDFSQKRLWLAWSDFFHQLLDHEAAKPAE